MLQKILSSEALVGRREIGDDEGLDIVMKQGDEGMGGEISTESRGIRASSGSSGNGGGVVIAQ